jgi:hypothetical protein
MVTGKNNLRNNFSASLFHLDFGYDAVVEPVIEFNGDDALLPSGIVLVGPALLRSAENTDFIDEELEDLD